IIYSAGLNGWPAHLTYCDRDTRYILFNREKMLPVFYYEDYVERMKLCDTDDMLRKNPKPTYASSKEYIQSSEDGKWKIHHEWSRKEIEEYRLSKKKYDLERIKLQKKVKLNIKDYKKIIYPRQISKLYIRGFLDLYPDKTFRADKLLNRKEAMEMILKASKFHSGKKCADQVRNKWFSPYLCTDRTKKIDLTLIDDSVFVTPPEAYEMLAVAFEIPVRNLKDNEEWYIPYYEISNLGPWIQVSKSELAKWPKGSRPSDLEQARTDPSHHINREEMAVFLDEFLYLTDETY
ncbi:MAG TPA: S-layer homology domain-containing protein, partial [Candidatus Gracilibacteria bacterium]|nr:S-layer homology domain-containing protein [Candidatus Gracilibacteria bacterium]